MTTTVEKAFAYLIRNGRFVLVMAHPDHPEAGLQVPAGTIESGETPAQAAARELREESGLGSFRLVGAVGIATFDMRPFGKAEFHRRHFFAFDLVGEAPEVWRHEEVHGGDGPIILEFSWLLLGPVPPRLIAGHDAFLGRLADVQGRMPAARPRDAARH